MRLPIRNHTDKPFLLLIEAACDEFQVPPDGEAIITLEDSAPHSIDIREGQVSVWDESSTDVAKVEVRTNHSYRG